MKNSFPRLFARKHRFFVLCLVLIAIVGFSISVSSHSGGAAEDSRRAGASNGVQKAGAASIIANVFNFPMPLPTITATMADSFPAGYDVDGDNAADVGDKIRYTVNINNTSGTDAATNLTVQDTVDPNTTFNAGSLVISPLAANDTYQSVGNMTLTSASIGADCNANSLHSVTCNDTLRSATLTGFGDTQANANANAPGATVTVSGKGSMTLNADGTFVFNPVGGYEGSVDFWYTINNTAGSDNAKVTINVGGANGIVWFINNNAGGSTNQGTQANPFTLLSTFAGLNNGTGTADTKPDAGNTIFLYESSTSYAGPVTLLNNQIFIGQDATTSLSTLGAPSPQLGNAYPTMNPSVTNVTITSAGLGITLASGNTLSGFNMTGVGATAISGTSFGTLKLSEVNVSSSSQALSLTTGTLASPTSSTATFGTISSGALGTNGILLSGVSGAMSATGGTLTGSAGGPTFSVVGGSVGVTYSGGITQAANNAAVSVSGGHSGTITFQTGTISATNGTGLQFDNADGTYNFNGTTTLGGGDAGVDITNGSGGSFSFSSSTSITNPSGVNFLVSGSTCGVTYSGNITQTSNSAAVSVTDHTTGTITFQTGTINATNGTGLQFTNADGTYNFNGTTTMNGGDAGIDILAGTDATNGSNGTFTFETATSINRANSVAGAAFNLAGSDGNVTYKGSMTLGTSTGNMVAINDHNTGTITFQTGNLTKGSSTTQGISIQNVNSGTVNFNNPTIAITMTSGKAVALATNTGGTINFTPAGGGNGIDLTSTTATTFDATGGGTIVVTGSGNTLSSTTGSALNVVSTTIGSSGLNFVSINVSGNDLAPTNGIVLNNTGSSGGLTVAGTGSAGTGGTIQNTSGDGISLTSTEKVSLSWMNITSNLGSGIGGSTINGFQLANCSITSNGDNAANDESGINVTQLFGTGSGGARPTSITNSTISNNWEFQIQITNSSGTLADLTMSGNTISSTGASGIIGNLFNFLGGSTSVMKLSLTSGTFTGNAPATATAISAVTQGSTHTVNVSGATFTNNNAGVDCSTSNVGGVTLNCNVSSNNFQGTRAMAINAFQNGNSPFNRTFNGTFANNTIGTAGTNLSGSSTGNGISVGDEGAISTMRVTITGNTITETIATGIAVDVGLFNATTGGGTAQVTIQNNNFSNIDSRAIIVQDNQDPQSPFPSVCSNITGNTFGSNITGQAGNGQVIRLKQTNGTHSIPQASIAALEAANTGATGKVSTSGTITFNGATCALSTAMLNIQGTPRNEYFAENNVEQTLAGEAFALLRSEGNNETIAETLNHVPPVEMPASTTSREKSIFSFDYVIKSSTIESASQPEATSSIITPEIQKGAYSLAHAETKGATLSGRVSNFISTVSEAVAPTAYAANAPQPMPVLEVNQNLGTLPAGKSLKIVFDVTVNGPHPVASYTNQMTVKADGITDVLTDDQPGTAAPNEPTVTPGDRYNTSTTLTASPVSPSFVGDTITFVAVVTPTEGTGVTPDGSIQFKDGVSNLGSAVTCVADIGNTCKAQLPTAALTAGAHSITAVYSGGTNHDASTSNTVSYTINACTSNPVVMNTSDGTSPVPVGSLREAITSACTGSTITFNAGVTGQINLVAALPNISRNLSIVGPGADQLEVSGSQAIGNSYRVFNITNSASTSINGLTISNGSDALGGGGINIESGSTLILTNSTVKNNSTTGSGGGIQNAGSLSVSRTTISNNVASLLGGGIYNTGPVGMTNTTVSNNTANAAGIGLGGGIYNDGGVQNFIIASSTIAKNTSDASGGGIYNGTGTVKLGNTIVADNTATASPDLSGAGTFDSQDYNLIENSTIVFTGTTTHNITGVDPVLGDLGNNGGTTYTHALKSGSPAIDAGNTNLTTDQRSQPRPVDNPNVANVGSDGDDIGAYEAPAPPSAPDLDAASDTGASNTDNLTSDNTPTFTIAGVTNGATVDLLLDGNPVAVATGVAAGTSIQLTSSTVGEGAHTFTARQTVAGGTSPESLGLSVTIDTVAPSTPTIDLKDGSDSGPSNTDNITNAATLNFDIGNTEAGTLVELLRDGVSIASVTSVGGTVTLADSPSEGNFVYTARQTDTGGSNAVSSNLPVTVDRTAPSVSSITRADANPTSAASVNFTVTFNENVTGVDTTDFMYEETGLAGTPSIANVTGSNNIYTVTVNTGTGDGTLKLLFSDNDSVVDPAGNPVGGPGTSNGSFTTGEVYTVDKTPPSVTSIVRANTSPTNLSSVNYTLTFSEGVTGVDTTDFSLTTTGVAGASVTGVTPVDASHYTVAVNTGTGDGTIRLDLTDNDSIADLSSKPLGGAGAGNGNFTTGEVYDVDKNGPSINIGAPSQAIAKSGNTVTFDVTYSDTNFSVSGLSTGDITLNTTGTANATVGVDGGNGTARTVTLSNLTGNGTLGISIASGTASDTVGNTAPAAGPSATFVVDNVAPSVSSIVRADTNPTSAASVNFTVTFSEDVTGVDTGDFSLTTTGGIAGASVTSVTPVDASHYTVAVNTGTGDGTIRLDVADNDSILDQASNPLGGTGAGNGNFTTGESYIMDKAVPSVSSIVRASVNPTNAASVNYTVTFSEDVTGVDTGDFSLTTTGVAGASVTGVTPVDTSHYTVAVNTGTGDGTIRLDVADNDSIVDQASHSLGDTGAGNGNFTTGEVYDVDKNGPSINIGAPSQSAAKSGDTVTYTITYADANFSASTLSTGNIALNTTGTASATVSVDASAGDTRTVTLSNLTGNGTLGILIASGTASDTAGNTAPGAGPSAAFVVDNVAPSVSSIVRADTNPTSAASVNYTVTFSEDVTGVDTTDFTLTTTGTLTSASVTSVTPVDASHYTVAVNTGSNDGTIRLDVADNDSIVDVASNPLGGTGAGNGNFTTGEVYTVDKNAPSVNITAVSPDPRNTSVSSITIVFTEAVTGFDLADLSLSLNGGANLLTGAQTLSSADNITWTLDNLSGLTGNEGTYTLTLTASGSGITDAGSNPLTGNASDTWVLDTTAPTVTIDQAATQTDPVLNAPGINFTVIFSEPVTGFDSADVTFSGAGATTATVTQIAPNDGTHYNVEITGMNTSGIVTASVNANAAQDVAGNMSAASTSTDNQVTFQLDTTTTYEVNNLADADDGACTALGTGNGCTLREAINAANLDGGSETITFAPALTSGGPAQITQTLGAMPDITDGVTITGPTNNRLTISGNLSSRIFAIAPSQKVTISNLTFIDGRDPVGGAIYSLGDLTITNSTFTGNKAIGPTAEGGAIDSEGGSITIINSTISGNSSDSDGGGLLNCGTSKATLINVTVTGNRSNADDTPPGDGGGIAQVSSNTLALINTIVAGNLKGTASPTADDIYVLGGSGGFDAVATKNNLIGDTATSGGLTNGTNGNIVGNAGVGTIDINTVLLTTLASNGGPTQTHLLLPGSPALGAGTNCVTLAAGSGGCLGSISPLTTDQRGTGFPRLVGTTVDMGAVEVDYFIQPIAGAPQSTLIGTDFPYPSKVFITESNKLVTGVPVIFDAPTSGPSGTFPGNLTSVAVNTDVNGIATTPTFTANNIAGGPYRMTAHITGTSFSTPIGDLTNLKLPAQITLGNLVQTYDGTPKAVSVTTNPPGLTVVVTYDGSTTVPTNVKPGGYAVVATINDASYDGQTTSTLTIDKANQTITFGALPAKTFGDPDFALSATTSAAGLSVSYAASGQCTVAGNTVHITGAGSCNITASQAGDGNYNAAPNVSQTLAINKANQTITLPFIGNKTFGTPDFAINPSANSGLDVGIVGSGSCSVTGNVVHLTGGGACTVTVTQNGNANYNAATPVSETFNIAKAFAGVNVQSSLNPSNPGDNVTFTATATTALSTKPTGTFQFKIDGSNFGAPITLDANAQASISTSTLSSGPHQIAATYSGDNNFDGITGLLSGVQTVNVQTSLSIDDVSVTEGDSGTKVFTFSVAPATPSNQTITVDYATANGTATAGSDYQAASGTLTILPQTIKVFVTVTVNGDTVNEPNETFFVNLSNAQNASIADNQGQGTILNDDAPGVQFSTNSFNFNEGAGHGDITVTRTGDTSQAMTVDYITSDQSAMTPCQTLNTGIASDRCDYATAAGILHFAAGEAQKTIPLVIVNDAYMEGAEQLSIKLINPTGGSLGSVDTATVTITDDDTQVATQNPIDNLDFFIRQLYIDFLGREPDAAGFNFWKARMTSPCPAGQQCDRIDTALRFFNSDEFDQRGYFVYVFYHAALGRRPTYSEWILDVAKLNGFQTPAEQQASRDAFINEFMNRQEFMNLYNGAQTADTFVDALIQKAGVNPASRQTLINNYATVGRAGTIKAFMETPEVQAAFKDRAFVTMLYFGFLRRDAEPGGFAFWMQKLNDTNHDYRQLIGGFINSDEYYYRYLMVH